MTYPAVYASVYGPGDGDTAAAAETSRIQPLATEILQGTDGGEHVTSPQISAADTGALADASLPLLLSATETASGTDAQARLALADADPARTALEASNSPSGNSVTKSDTDFGTAQESDPATVRLRDFDTSQDAAHALADTEQAAFTDAGEALARTDAEQGAFTDAGFPGGHPQDADLLLGTESPELTHPQEPAGNSADTASAAEASLQPAVPIASTDTGTGTESTGAALPQVRDAETITGTDGGESVVTLVSGSETIVSLDSGPGGQEGLFAVVPDTDSASGADSAAIATQDPDAATAADASAASFRILAADPDTGTVATTAESGFIPTLPHSEESARFTDNQSVTVTISDRDSGTSIEGYAYDIPLFTHWQDAPGTFVLAGVIAPGTGAVSALAGIRSAAITLNQQQYTMAGNDAEQGAWTDITDITVAVEEGFLPFQTAAAILGYSAAADASGNQASLPYMVMAQSQSSPVPVVLRSFAQDHFGNYRTTDIILYAVTFTSFAPSGTASYKEGMAVTWAGRAVRSFTDENGAALPPGATPAFGRVQSQPGTSYALVLQTGPAVQVSPVDLDFIFSDDEESAGASFRDSDTAATAEAGQKGVAAAIGPSADTWAGTEAQSVLKGVQLISSSDTGSGSDAAAPTVGIPASLNNRAADTGSVDPAAGESSNSPGSSGTQFGPMGMSTGGTANTLDISASGVLLLGGDVDGLFLSYDQGVHWTAVQTGVSAGFNLSVAYACWSQVEANAAYALCGLATGGGGFLASTDGGNTWAVRNSNLSWAGNQAPLGGQISGGTPRSTGKLLAQDSVNGLLYTGTYQTGVYRSADFGATWTLIGGSPGANGFPAGTTVYYCRSIVIDPNNPSIVYAAFYGQGVWKTSNARAASPSWTKTSAPAITEELAIASSPGSTARFGGSCSTASYGDADAVSSGLHLDKIVGRTWAGARPGVQRKYIQSVNSTLDGGLKAVPTGSADPESVLALTTAGVKVILSLRPWFDTGSAYPVNGSVPDGSTTFGAERTKLANWLSFYNSKGVPPSLLEVSLYHEVNIHASIFPAASDYAALIAFYGQTVVNSGYPLDFISAINAPGNCNLYYPSAHNSWFTQIITDYYATDFSPNPNHCTLTGVFGSHGQTLSWIDFVDSMGKKPGIGEWGFTNGATQPTNAALASWIQNQVMPVFTPRPGKGLPCGDIVWFDYGNTTHGNLIETAADSPTDPNPMPQSTITLLKGFYDAYTGPAASVLYAACGSSGLYRSTDNGATWAAVNGPMPDGTTLTAGGAYWSSIQAYVQPADGSHLVLAGCGGGLNPAAGNFVRSFVSLTVPSRGTGTPAYADIIAASTMDTTHIPPTNRAWWHTQAASSAVGYHNYPGGGSYINPWIIADPNNLQHLYAAGPSACFRSLDGGNTWGLAMEGLQLFGVTDIQVDPNDSSHLVLGTYDWCSFDVTDVQGTLPGSAALQLGTPGGGQTVYSFAFNPANSDVWAGAATKETNTGGEVYFRSKTGTSWTATGFGTAAGGNRALGLYAGLDAGSNLFVIAVSQGAGLWRWTSAGGWAQPTGGSVIGASGADPAGTSHPVSGSGALLFAFDHQSGLYRSTNFGTSWTKIWNIRSTNSINGKAILNPTVANELWVTCTPVSSGDSGVYQLAGANTGTVGSGITPVAFTNLPGSGIASQLAIKAGGTHGTVYVLTLADPSQAVPAAQLWATANAGSSWVSAGDSSVGAWCSPNPRHMRLAGNRLVIALGEPAGPAVWGIPSV